MSTSVRFPDRIEQELSSYCVARGITKSELLTTAVTQYLINDKVWAQLKARDAVKKQRSRIFHAFEAGGLIGVSTAGSVAREVGTQSADKELVRRVARARLSR